MSRTKVSVSVRAVVELALLSGSLLPGMQLSRMREGTIAHKARQASMPDAQSEVMVRATVPGTHVTLAISGRIDLLAYRGDIPVIEEIKLAPAQEEPQCAEPVHRAQAICYGHMLGEPEAIIRIVYVRMDGSEVCAFEEYMSAAALRTEFDAFVAPYLRMAEARVQWQTLRDASIEALAFPFSGYRAGQRDMAVQAYLAIRRRKRLFAEAPTGTGKTAAALFPALKALGEGLTGQIFYLTARTTAQENATVAIQRMRDSGLRLRALALTAKEKICPMQMTASQGEQDDAIKPPAFRCDVLECPRAIGFFDRLPDALYAMRELENWSREAVEAVAAAHQICPFEFGLSLCEEADAVLCDYNYAFDPAVRIKRIFQFTKNVTLLIDEAHNLPGRARDMLSATIDSGELRESRRMAGKVLGRRCALYEALTALIRFVEAREPGTDPHVPLDMLPLVQAVSEAALPAMQQMPLQELSRMLAAALGALDRFDARYTVLTQAQGKATRMTLYCMDPSHHVWEVTRKLRGNVFFSATMTPLAAFRDAIGGDEEDGLLSLSSPFPRENLLVLRSPIQTRYRARERTAAAVAEAILAVVRAHPGNYFACFPSYAYLNRVREEIEMRDGALEIAVQRSRMDDAARAAFLESFSPRSEGSMLGMVVMGGVFGEGIDLPGDRLSGAIIVGVGLPQVCEERELLRRYYEESLGDGFAHAYRYPGMNKVLQAVGRVIRTETDRGVALLIDDRFSAEDYAALMPHWWGSADVLMDAAAIGGRVSAFWMEEGTASGGKRDDPF